MALTEAMIRTLPRKTGVYILRDAAERIVYIGKARNLRARLRSYLHQDDRIQTPGSSGTRRGSTSSSRAARPMPCCSRTR